MTESISYHNRFNPFQAQWLQDLRSGKHKQAKGKLWRKLDPNNGIKSFCCVGRMMDLFDPESSRMASICIDGNFESSRYDGIMPSDLPQMNLHVLGLPKLYKMNDDLGYSFSQIADEVCKEPWVFFTNFDNPNTTD